MSSLKRWRQIGQGEFHRWTEKGDSLEGLWRGQRDGQYGPLGTLETEQGLVSFPLHIALLQRVEHVREGSEIKIVYTGKHVSKGGREFKGFEVFVAEATDIEAPNADDPDDVPF